MRDLPPGWELWNEEPGGRIILAYRPDVFDGGSFPPECLPTLTVGPGASPDLPPDRRRGDRWHAALYLEPAVRVRDCDAAFDSREGAVEAAIEVARRFSAGEVDYRGAYQLPREAYLAELDALCCREA